MKTMTNKEQKLRDKLDFVEFENNRLNRQKPIYIFLGFVAGCFFCGVIIILRSL